MNAYRYKRIISSICISLLIFLFCQQVKGQQEKPLSFNDVLMLLNFTSRISKSNEKINKQLAMDIRKDGVNFTLSSAMEESLKKAGGDNLLIKTIREQVPKYLEEKTLLYRKFTDNYNGTFEQKRLALEAAKEFVKKFSNDADNEGDIKEIIRYFKENIPILEETITRHTNYNCKCPCQ